MNELGNVNIRETPWMDIEYSNVQMTVGHSIITPLYSIECFLSRANWKASY
jgi:hypothetical protein